MITFTKTPKGISDATLILVVQDQLQDKKLAVSKCFAEQIETLRELKKFSGKRNEIFPFLEKKKLIVCFGLGKQSVLSHSQLRTSIRSALLSSYLKTARTVQIIPHEQTEKTIRALIEGIIIGTYRFDKYITKKENPTAKKYILVAPPKDIYKNTVTISQNVNFIRDLVNDNADTVTSRYLEKIVRRVTKNNNKTVLTVLNKEQLKTKGLNLHLAVNQGSAYEPKLIIVKYSGGKVKDPYTALVGKGITFDTGGLNLKPTGYMESMRLDMGGAAAVIGCLKNTVDLKIKKNILFIIGVAENAIGSKSYKPGDIIKSYSGKTVFVANTDAEGRLVLADALSYLVKNYKPKRIIDFATLTGACVVALGYDYTGLMSNTPKMAEQLLSIAQETDDRAWQLPLYSELSDHLKSPVADLKSTGLPKGAAGTISAGEFLRQFVGNTPWAHLDIAGTAFNEGTERLYFGHGATGAGVRLVTEYLQKYS